MDNEEWYTNKDLFQLIDKLRDDFKDLSGEMQETRRIIKQYNGLREELVMIGGRLEAIEEKAKGREEVWDGIRKWGGWIFGLGSLIVAVCSLVIKA